jgi:hypothetical protein
VLDLSVQLASARFVATLLPPLPFYFSSLLSVDMNGDGRPDLVTSGSGALQVLIGLP